MNSAFKTLTFIARLLARLPLPLLHVLGSGLGWLAYWTSSSYQERTHVHLQASGLCPNPTLYRQALHTAIAGGGQAVTEAVKVWFESERMLLNMVQCTTWGVVEAAQQQGRGVIFLTPHLGCFEICGFYLAQQFPLTILYRPSKNKLLDQLMAVGRLRGQAVLAPANLKGVRLLFKALRRGEAIGILPDQVPSVGEGQWADFFGRPAYTMTLVSRLQHTTGSPVVMVFAERLPHGQGFYLHCEAVNANPLDARSLNAAIEHVVQRAPGQYLWGYNRYKSPSAAASQALL